MECPRWRLTTAHYLNVPVLPDGTSVEWEHKETNRESGRAIRKLYPVPMLLDPRDPADHNYPGEIIVAQPLADSTPQQRDVVFIGDPTPDMEPINDSAKAISDRLQQRWMNPVESLPANGGMNEAERAFMDNMIRAFTQQAPQPNTLVPKAEFDALKAELEAIKALLPVKSEAPQRRA